MSDYCKICRHKGSELKCPTCVITCASGKTFGKPSNYEPKIKTHDEEKQIVNVQWTINLPMSFPSHWDKENIEFHLNDSSWCCDNLIDSLQEYSLEHGCICDICNAKVK